MNDLQQIHRRVTVLDSHVDIPPNYATPMVDPGVRQLAQVDLPKMEEGGMNAAFFIAYVGQGNRNAFSYARARDAALNKFHAIHRMVARNADRIGLGTSSSDLRAHREAGRMTALIGIENAYVIGTDLGLLEQYHALGARYVTLTHNGHNDVGDSSVPVPELGDRETLHGGLSALGQAAVREMNRLGIMVDVSHTSKATMLDALRASRAPVIASHSSVHALTDHPRNLDDEQLDALKARNGVVQIAAVAKFLRAESKEQLEAVGRLRRELGLLDWHADRYAPEALRAELHRRLETEIYAKWPCASVADLVDHVDYVVRRIGIDHVGIASDFDGGGGIAGWNHAGETANVTAELLRRGYSEPEIEKIWSGNLLRVMEEAERLSAN